MNNVVDIVAEIDFNRDDDKEEYSCDPRVVRLSSFEDNGTPKIGLSFNLGRREDDSISLVFDCERLLATEIEAIIS